MPKLFYVNNSSEYWNRAASLIATDPEGERDLPPAPEARIYHIAGAQHYVGGLRERGMFTSCVNTLDHYRAMRALMAAFESWVRDGVEPPPSTYPRIADGTLVTVGAFKEAFPRIPDFRLPESNLRPPRLDLGKRFESERIADAVPPIIGQAVRGAGAEARCRRARPGRHRAAGNAGAARHPHRLQYPQRSGRLPLGHRPLGRLVRAVCAHRGGAAGIRRSAPSLAARYANRAAYEEKVRAAAAAVVDKGFLLPEDVDALVGEAGGLYDRIMAHDPADPSCRYLFGR